MLSSLWAFSELLKWHQWSWITPTGTNIIAMKRYEIFQEGPSTEDEMVGWHHRLHGHKFEQGPGVGDGQGSLACCTPWGHRESDTTERLNWTEEVPKWDVKWSNTVGKMALIDVLEAGLPQTSSLLKKQYLWSKMKQSAIKWGMSI